MANYHFHFKALKSPILYTILDLLDNYKAVWKRETRKFLINRLCYVSFVLTQISYTFISSWQPSTNYYHLIEIIFFDFWHYPFALAMVVVEAGYTSNMSPALPEPCSTNFLQPFHSFLTHTTRFLKLSLNKLLWHTAAVLPSVCHTDETFWQHCSKRTVGLKTASKLLPQNKLFELHKAVNIKLSVVQKPTDQSC